MWHRWYAFRVLPVVAVLALATGCTGTERSLEGTTSDEELVNLGYMEVPRQQFAGSASTVAFDDIEPIATNDLRQLIAERVAGVNLVPGPTGMELRIRGTYSLTGGEEPLFVIDGLPVSGAGALFGIDPQNVKTVTVLKDFASRARYGQRGLHGVIVIETKDGQ